MRAPQGASFFNDREIEEVANIVRSLRKETDCRAEDIGVITPWREQVWRLRKVLRENGHSGVNVGNIEVGASGATKFSLGYILLHSRHIKVPSIASSSCHA